MNSTKNNNLKTMLLFFPVVLIVLQSYFKSYQIQFFSDILHWNAAFCYWTLRLALFVLFITALFKIPLRHTERPEEPEDIYGDRRSLRDPLLSLRALACLNVFLGHWFLVVFSPIAPAQTSGDEALRLLSSFSPWCGVWIFFTLSGYLMGKGFVTGRHSTNREGLLLFYFNRIRRIFPIYFISIFIVAVLVRPELLDLRSQEAWNAVFESVLFDQQGGNVIAALWSISTEFQFYLMAPFLFLLLMPLSGSIRALTAFSVFVLISLSLVKYVILITHPELWQSRIYFPVLLNLDCFVSGMITSFVVNNMRARKVYMTWGMTIGTCLAVFSQIIFSVWSFQEMASYPGLPGSATRFYYLSIAPAVTAFLTSLIIFFFEISERIERRNVNIFWRASTIFGSITYCLYVWHEPIIVSLRRIFPQDLSIFDSIFAFPFGFALTIGIASLFYFFVEKFFDRIPFPKLQRASGRLS